MSLLGRKRNARGQYEVDFNATDEGSVVGKLVREEYEAFVERLNDKLNTLSPADLAHIETPNWKDDIRSVLKQYLGASTAKVAVNFVKTPSAWNLFIKENFARKASELRGEDATGMTFSTYLTFRRAGDRCSLLEDHGSPCR
jgi:molybdenum cofactor biosynthesis enzyme MoaA